MSELVSNVHVFSDEKADFEVFGPEDDVPEWAAVKMGAHCFVDGDHPFPSSDYPGKDTAKLQREPGVEPPRQGAGASKAAWLAFAEEKGKKVADGATRDQIIAGLIDAGVIE